MTEFKGPIVEGAYYERNDAQVVGPAKAGVGGVFSMGEDDYYADGDAYFTEGVWLTRRVYITHTDPAEVVAELREMHRRADQAYDEYASTEYNTRQEIEANTWEEAADLVAEKLGVKS